MTPKARSKGRGLVEVRMDELKAKGNDRTAKEEDQLPPLQVVNEMLARGLEFCRWTCRNPTPRAMPEDGKMALLSAP